MADTKMCPYCGEDIKFEAIKCKHCQTMLSKEDGLVSADMRSVTKVKKPLWQQWWIWVFVALLIFIVLVLLNMDDLMNLEGETPLSEDKEVLLEEVFPPLSEYEVVVSEEEEELQETVISLLKDKYGDMMSVYAGTKNKAFHLSFKDTAIYDSAVRGNLDSIEEFNDLAESLRETSIITTDILEGYGLFLNNPEAGLDILISVKNGQIIHNFTDKIIKDANEPGNLRSNPAGLFETTTVNYDAFCTLFSDDGEIEIQTGQLIFEVELLELISGAVALDIVRKANMFNTIPDEGSEYILAKFRVKYIKSEIDEPNKPFFDAISGSGTKYSGVVGVAGLDSRIPLEVIEGEEYIGWECFIVDIDDESPLAVMDRFRDSERWFLLRN